MPAHIRPTRDSYCESWENPLVGRKSSSTHNRDERIGEISVVNVGSSRISGECVNSGDWNDTVKSKTEEILISI